MAPIGAKLAALDLDRLPRPAQRRYVWATTPCAGGPKQLALATGDRILVLHAKEGVEWAIGELDNGARGLYPSSLVTDEAVQPLRRSSVVIPSPRGSSVVSPRGERTTSPRGAEGATSPRRASGAMSPRANDRASGRANDTATTLRNSSRATESPSALPRTSGVSQVTMTRTSTSKTVQGVVEPTLRASTAQPVTTLVSPRGEQPRATGTARPARSKTVGDSVDVARETDRDEAIAAAAKALPAFLLDPPPQMDAKKKTVLNARPSWLLVAAHSGDEKLFRQLLKQGVTSDVRDTLTGDSAIIVAARANREAMVKVQEARQGSV